MRGRCLCGKVSVEAEPPEHQAHACHCTMCRRWTGSALICVTVPESAIRVEGREHIRTIQSSDWAERAWCDGCGSGLWYRITMEGPLNGTYEIPLGLFDDPDGVPLVKEIYIDRKPDGYAFAGTHKTMTEAEVEAMFGMGETP